MTILALICVTKVMNLCLNYELGSFCAEITHPNLYNLHKKKDTSPHKHNVSLDDKISAALLALPEWTVHE